MKIGPVPMHLHRRRSLARVRRLEPVAQSARPDNHERSLLGRERPVVFHQRHPSREKAVKHVREPAAFHLLRVKPDPAANEGVVRRAQDAFSVPRHGDPAGLGRDGQLVCPLVVGHGDVGQHLIAPVLGPPEFDARRAGLLPSRAVKVPRVLIAKAQPQRPFLPRTDARADGVVLPGGLPPQEARL